MPLLFLKDIRSAEGTRCIQREQDGGRPESAGGAVKQSPGQFGPHSKTGTNRPKDRDMML